MTTPTPDFGEPWFRVVQGKQHMIADRRDHFIVANDVKAKQEVVSRIIACVNACQGVPTERLQPGSVKALVEASNVIEMGTAAAISTVDHDDFLEWVNALGIFREPTNG